MIMDFLKPIDRRDQNSCRTRRTRRQKLYFKTVLIFFRNRTHPSRDLYQEYFLSTSYLSSLSNPIFLRQCQHMIISIIQVTLISLDEKKTGQTPAVYFKPRTLRNIPLLCTDVNTLMKSNVSTLSPSSRNICKQGQQNWFY